MKKQRQERCKRCGQALDSGYYAEHLAKFHNDFSKMKDGRPSLL